MPLPIDLAADILNTILLVQTHSGQGNCGNAEIVISGSQIVVRFKLRGQLAVKLAHTLLVENPPSISQLLDEHCSIHPETQLPAWRFSKDPKLPPR